MLTEKLLTYLLVFFVALQCSDRVLTGVQRNAHTLGDFGWRGRSLEETIVSLGGGRFLAGLSGRDGCLEGEDRKLHCGISMGCVDVSENIPTLTGCEREKNGGGGSSSVSTVQCLALYTALVGD